MNEIEFKYIDPMLPWDQLFMNENGDVVRPRNYISKEEAKKYWPDKKDEE
jgi:hypothetical protein